LEIITRISPFTQEHKPRVPLRSRLKLKPRPNRLSKLRVRIRRQLLERKMRRRKLNETPLELKFLL
jgi:hypothetical protein